MTGAKDATLRTLRLKYNAALAAQQGCTRALTEANMAGTTPSAELVAQEAKARQQLEHAREQLRAAMTEAITGQKAGEPIAAEPLPPNARNRPPDAAS